MATIKLKRGIADSVDGYVGVDGEVVIDKTNWGLRICDGVTAGGHVVSGGNQSSNDLAVAIEQTISFYNGYKKQSLDYRDYLTNDNDSTLAAIYGIGNGYKGVTV